MADSRQMTINDVAALGGYIPKIKRKIKMPKAEITGYKITKTWDDGSTGTITISSGTLESSGPYVRVKDESEEFLFDVESWPIIREIVDELFKQMEAQSS